MAWAGVFYGRSLGCTGRRAMPGAVIQKWVVAIRFLLAHGKRIISVPFSAGERIVIARGLAGLFASVVCLVLLPWAVCDNSRALKVGRGRKDVIAGNVVHASRPEYDSAGECVALGGHDDDGVLPA